MKRILIVGGIVLLLAACGGGGSQSPTNTPPASAQEATQDPGVIFASEIGAALDYALWERMAERAEAEIQNRNTSSERMEEIRAQLAKWRAALLSAQSANSARITTLRSRLEGKFMAVSA